MLRLIQNYILPLFLLFAIFAALHLIVYFLSNNFFYLVIDVDYLEYVLSLITILFFIFWFFLRNNKDIKFLSQSLILISFSFAFLIIYYFIALPSFILFLVFPLTFLLIKFWYYRKGSLLLNKNIYYVISIFFIIILIFNNWLYILQNPMYLLSSDGREYLKLTRESNKKYKEKIKVTESLFNDDEVRVLSIKDYTEDVNNNGIADHIIIEIELHIPIDYKYRIKFGDLVASQYIDEYSNYKYGYSKSYPNFVFLDNNELSPIKTTWYQISLGKHLVELKYNNIQSDAAKLKEYNGSFELCKFDIWTYDENHLQYFQNNKCYSTSIYNLNEFEIIKNSL